MKLLGISAYRLSKDIGIPQTRTSMIIIGNRKIPADTALRQLGTSEQVLNFGWDFKMIFIWQEELVKLGKELRQIPTVN